MYGRTARTALKTRTGRQAAKSAAKGTFRVGRSRGGRGGAKAGAKGLGKLAKTGAKVKAGKEAGRAGAKGATKAGKGFGKLASKKGQREVRRAEKTLKSERSSGGSRLLKFGFLALAGLGVGALVARLAGGQDGGQGSSSTDTTQTDRSESTGGDDAGRAHSDPSSGPLIGESHQENIEGVTESQPEAEERIRTRIGEDERTRDMPRVNVEVNGSVAELRGAASSEEMKEAAGEIAAEVEGVSEVRNLIEVSS